MADAEDAVQEAYLRWHTADRDSEQYVGPWLPEPVLDTAELAPYSRTELAEDLSIALLLILDQLSPLERGAFLLYDVFDFSFREVAIALQRSEAACRQLASRARARTSSSSGDSAPNTRCVMSPRARSRQVIVTDCASAHSQANGRP